jgi:pimeloyl-ACP methyl ester carboxylesterase
LQVKAFSPSFTVVTLDNRGVGETDLPPDPVYSTAQMAEDAAVLLRQLKIDRAHVVGASMGGTIAQELALRHPKLVRSLVLACTWTAADARFLHTIQAWAALANRVPVEERFRHVLYPWLYSPGFFEAKQNIETAFQRALAYPHQSKPEGIERQARGILEWNGTRTKRLGDIKAPTLVLVGKDDILTPPAFAKAVAKGIKKSRLTVLPGGHGFCLEEADLFNRTVLRFLKAARA